MATAKVNISYPHVTKTPDVCGGKACIDGTRIRVNNVVFLHKDGANDEKIRTAYPDLTRAQIHAALAYYYDNREEIEAELVADASWAESLRLCISSARQRSTASLSAMIATWRSLPIGG